VTHCASEGKHSNGEEEIWQAGSIRREEKPTIAPPKVKRDRTPIRAELSEVEQDLVSHMERGWRLETDSLDGNPTLRNLKSDEVVRLPPRTAAQWRLWAAQVERET